MDRAEKKELVASLGEVFNKTSVVVVAHYSGLTVAQMQKLRKQMGAAGATVQVAKNRLAKIALEGTDVASISPLLKGPTLIAYSDDPVAAPKVAVAFAKDHDKLVILGGAMGKTALNVDGVKSVSYTHLDVYKRQVPALPERRTTLDRGIEPNPQDADGSAPEKTRFHPSMLAFRMPLRQNQRKR